MPLFTIHLRHSIHILVEYDLRPHSVYKMYFAFLQIKYGMICEIWKNVWKGAFFFLQGFSKKKILIRKWQLFADFLKFAKLQFILTSPNSNSTMPFVVVFFSIFSFHPIQPHSCVSIFCLPTFSYLFLLCFMHYILQCTCIAHLCSAQQPFVLFFMWFFLPVTIFFFTWTTVFSHTVQW